MNSEEVIIATGASECIREVPNTDRFKPSHRSMIVGWV